MRPNIQYFIMKVNVTVTIVAVEYAVCTCGFTLEAGIYLFLFQSWRWNSVSCAV